MGRPTIIYLRVSTRGFQKIRKFQSYFFEGRRLELEPIAGPKKRGKNFRVIFFVILLNLFYVEIPGLLSSLNNHKSGKVITLR